jgi:sterol desaturase/sphingolipid hydroxylase (fatty acid hydroxylase superfamily)
MDAWQYFLHRAMHSNRFLYKHIHSMHHRLYAPFSFGSIYNHPVEGFFLDILGGAVAEAAAGLSPRQAALFFSFAMLKGVEDHSGYQLPWSPLQLIFANCSDYHDIHHQVRDLHLACVENTDDLVVCRAEVQLLTAVLHSLRCPPRHASHPRGHCLA